MKRIVSMVCVVALLYGPMGCVHKKYTYKRNLDEALATYDGEISAPGLSEPVHIYRDSYGVPHVFAENELDMFFATGYVHAQDRLWEMMLFRAVAEGRTAELFGKAKVPGASFKGFPIDTLVIDQQQRTIGMKHVGEAGAALLKEFDPATYAQLEAYSNGVNHYLARHSELKQLPVEFQILNVKPEPWTPADVISFSRLMGFILGYNMLAELLRAGLMDKYGEDFAWSVAPIHDNFGPTIVPTELLHNKLDKPRLGLPPGGKPSLEEAGGPPVLSADAAEMLMATNDIARRTVSADLPFASNNWVLSPSITTTGTAMLENDTHMPHIQPSIWHMGHLHCPGVDVYGSMFPGIAYPPLGHTRDLSWSATTSIADVQDLFVETVDEENHPGQYLHKGEWKDFTIRKEIIRVRQTPFRDKFKEVEIEIRQTVHGPILTDFLPLPEGTPPTALRWVAWDFSRDQRLFDLLVHSADIGEFMSKVRAMDDPPEIETGAKTMSMLIRGKSVDDFKKAMEILDMPNQNWMAADSQGNISYLPGGFIPIRGAGVGAIPVDGSSGKFDWTGFIPIDEHPRLDNPERGYINSGNNEVVDAEWYPYIFDLNYDSGWRAWRVEELINELKPIDMDDMVRIANDVYLKKAEWEVPLILKAIEDKNVTDPQVLRAYDILKDWDYESGLHTPAPTIFFKYAQDMRYNVYGDHVSEEDFDTYLSESHVDIAVEALLKKGESPLFDDVTTPDKVEDMQDCMVKSVKTAMTFIEDKYGQDPENWMWGDVHVMKFFHPLGFGPFKDLSVYVGPHVGGRMAVRCASPADGGKWHFKAMNGTSWRQLIDMGDVENAKVMIDGSISGQWLSPHYKDLVKVWHAGDFLKATMDRGDVENEARYHLVLTPR